MALKGLKSNFTLLKAGVSSKQLLKRDTLANTYSPSLALDMATTSRRTSLKNEQEILPLIKQRDAPNSKKTVSKFIKLP